MNYVVVCNWILLFWCAFFAGFELSAIVKNYINGTKTDIWTYCRLLTHVLFMFVAIGNLVIINK